MAKKAVKSKSAYKRRRATLKRKKAAIDRMARKVAANLRKKPPLRKPGPDPVERLKRIERVRLAQKNIRVATYFEITHRAVVAGEVEDLIRALIMSAITEGSIDDNILNESVGMFHWVLRQMKAKRLAREGKVSEPDPDLDRLRNQMLHGGDDDLDGEDDDYGNMDGDEGERRFVHDDRSFP